jgi:threonine/homoserine/homoserine lactone efflux protein
MLVNLKATWSSVDMLNRMSTGMAVALLALGLSEGIWQNLAFPAVPPLQFFIMLLITAVGATVGTAPRISARIFRSVTWATRRVRRVVLALAIVLGAGLGFALTNGFAYGLFSLLGIALGIAVAMLLVRCADSLITQNYPTP